MHVMCISKMYDSVYVFSICVRVNELVSQRPLPSRKEEKRPSRASRLIRVRLRPTPLGHSLLRRPLLPLPHNALLLWHLSTAAYMCGAHVHFIAADSNVCVSSADCSFTELYISAAVSSG